MELVQKIDKKCAETLPYYSEVAEYTLQKYNYGLTHINSLYDCSTKKIKTINKVSKRLKKHAGWLLSQRPDDLLNLLEQKLEVTYDEKTPQGKAKRLFRIYEALKSQHFLFYIEKLAQIKRDWISKVYGYKDEYLLPLYLRFSATVMVSRQMLLEAFESKMTSLKMTYKCSKDSITMYWSGQFKEEQVLTKVKEHLGTFKEFTISFVQKGMEIKISKQDLLTNYHKVMETLTDILKGVSEKGVESWSATKAKTMDLYLSALNRIKAKEQQLKITMGARKVESSKIPGPEETNVPQKEEVIAIKPQKKKEVAIPAQAEPQNDKEAESQSQPENDEE